MNGRHCNRVIWCLYPVCHQLTYSETYEKILHWMHHKLVSFQKYIKLWYKWLIGLSLSSCMSTVLAMWHAHVMIGQFKTKTGDMWNMTCSSISGPSVQVGLPTHGVAFHTSHCIHNSEKGRTVKDSTKTEGLKGSFWGQGQDSPQTSNSSQGREVNSGLVNGMFGVWEEAQHQSPTKGVEMGQESLSLCVQMEI